MVEDVMIWFLLKWWVFYYFGDKFFRLGLNLLLFLLLLFFWGVFLVFFVVLWVLELRVDDLVGVWYRNFLSKWEVVE